MKYTTKLSLKKPDLEDFYNVEDFNLNADKLDRAVGSLMANIKKKADIESPHLTGIPTAPTASSNTNTTQIATTEFVKTALATFNLAEYLKVADAQRTYAPLNSPRLTGTPVAPTPSNFSEDASIATTEWVKRILNTSGGGIVAANLNQNGYVKFANGLILQWGTYAFKANSYLSHQYPIAFASKVFGLWATVNIQGWINGGELHTIIKDHQTFEIKLDTYDNQRFDGSAFVLAIGM